MRLLHVTPTYIPAFRYGGPIHAVHGLCRSLADSGHDVHVLTTSVDGANDSDVPYDRPVDIDGVSVHYCRSRFLRRLYWSADLSARCRAIVRNVDVVHIHSVFLFPTRAGARSASKAGIPYVLSPRGMLVRELISRRSGTVKRAWIALIERKNLARAAVIHLTSDEERRALADICCALAPTVVIPNGVDLPSRFSPARLSTDVRGLLTEGFDVLSFGRISWKKALDRLILALTDLPGTRALVAGNDEEGEVIRLRALAAARGVAERVRFLPRHVGGADKEALFAAARVFALPSLSENFGNVVVEAMVRGLPVVVTQTVGAAELVSASGGGVVVPNDIASFGAALGRMLASPQAAAAAGAAGATYVKEHLSWTRIASRFVDLYQEVALARAVNIGLEPQAVIGT